MRVMTGGAIALACVALLPACDHGTDPKPKSANFTASVVGASPASLSGDAGFVIAPTVFTIALVNAANDQKTIQFSRLGGTPAAGSYSLAPGAQGSGNFVAIYAGGAQENYVSTDGALTLTSVSADQVSGDFSFAAAGGTTGSAHVSISGHFVAKRLSAR